MFSWKRLLMKIWLDNILFDFLKLFHLFNIFEDNKINNNKLFFLFSSRFQ